MNCPSCGSNRVKRGEANLWCAACGFFPISFKRDPHLALIDAEAVERKAGDTAGVAQLAYYTALAGFGENIPFDAELYGTLPELEATYHAAVDAWKNAHTATLAARSEWLKSI